MELLIILGLILLNGIFALSEMALVSSKRFKLENLSKKGSQGAKTAIDLSENPTRFFSTAQIGITLIGILLGVYSGENLTNDIVTFLEKFDSIKPYSKPIATMTIVIFITYLSIVLGELFPKRIGMTFPESMISFFSRPMHILSVITYPFVWILTLSNNFLVQLLGLSKISDSRASEEEIKSIIKESAESGEIEHIEHDIVERVFELGDRKVNSLLTHRKDIIFFTSSDTLAEIKTKIGKERHSIYPVSSTNNIDDIIGIVQMKDLFLSIDEKKFELQKYIKKPVFVNENTLAYKVLEIFKKEKNHSGIVVDEYGSTVGIVTMDDVVDALFGDVTEKDQEEYSIIQRDENSWLVDGQFSIYEFIKYFQLDAESYLAHRYTTVAGLIIHKTNRLPNVGEKIYLEDYVLEILDKDKQRIDKILVTKP
ncbi:MAG: HlyC/CorC family transporter [Saprospiraceae bacterium]|nr:HlyC/CorC family transporter [Saprospiraceae bacterium]MBK8855077.1 HlyC/CorC family transporter [Saprospiraceae bacterium]MBK9044074.1 HlyC/CorC family transporter [Saprospiraceae bacterium]